MQGGLDGPIAYHSTVREAADGAMMLEVEQSVQHSSNCSATGL